MKIWNGGSYILLAAILAGTLLLTGCPRRALVYEEITPGAQKHVVEKPAPAVAAPPLAAPKVDPAQEKLLREQAAREELERERKIREEEIRLREAKIKALQEELARAEALVAQRPVGLKEAPIKPTVIEKAQQGVEKQILANIYFDFDRSEIRPEFREILRQHAEWMKRNPGRILLIEGHCDERGTHEYNLALGERRAAAVFNFLVALGVDKARMRTISYGEEVPADPRSNEEAWAKNRRAVFVIDPK